MNHVIPEQQCHCQCGKTEFTLKGKPLTRIYCHCTICQEFNGEDFADVTMFLTKDVEFDQDQNVDFKKYKAPPAVDRGKCGSCHKPIIEFISIPLFPSLTVIPSRNIEKGHYLPESGGHIFYHRRVNDIDDKLPKYSGFMSSQTLLLRNIVLGMLGRKNKE